jgi:predicted ATPase
VAQSRFFEGVAQALKALLAGAPPGLLVIDDVHHADGATLEWLSYLIRRLALYRFCVLLTWRSGDVPAAHRLRQLAGECARQGNAVVIALDRLAPAAIVRWVGQSVARTGFDRERLAKRLYVESEGLPFFVAEYLNMLANNELPGLDAAWPAPGRVRDFLLARLAPLTEVARQVLAAAAAIGRSFDADTIMAAAGRSEDETLTALEELLARRTILESGAQQLDFSHAQLRQIVYEEISHLRRRLLHRRIGDALAMTARRTGAEETVAGALAYHYQLGGEPVRAAHFAFLAGEQARRLYANREAIGYFKQALVLGAPERCTLYTHLGDLRTLLGEYGQAEEAYAAALGCCLAAERAGLEHRLGRLRDRLGDAAGAAHHLAAAHALLPSDDLVAQAQIMIDWSLAIVRTQNDPAHALARQALAVAERAKDAATLARAYTLLALLARRAGDLAAAREAGEAGVGAARSQSDPGVLAAALNSLALVHADDNNPATALQLVQEALTQVVRIGDRHREAALRNTLADLLHAGRETEQAMEQLKQAVVIFSEIGSEAGSDNAEIWMLREW